MEVQWKDVLDEVAKHVPSMYYIPFIMPLSMKGQRGERLILSAPSEIIKNHVVKKYQHHIEEAITKLSGQNLSVEILVDTDPETPISTFVEEKFRDGFSFNSDYTMTSYLIGDSNCLAVGACKEILKQPGKFNPLYIFGGVGVGKTHLLHAIGSELEKISPEHRVKYTSISAFLSEFVYTLQNKQSVEAFRLKYHSYSTLIIDDIQYLNSSAEKTQEEFYALFNHFYERKKQIIIAADRPIAELPLQDRLKSRFTIGHQVEIRPPDAKIRQRLLREKARELDLQLSENILEYIAETFKSDTRHLLGSLNEISLYKKTFQILIIPDEKILEILQARIDKQSKTLTTPDKIIDSVCEYYGQERCDVLSKSRRAEYILPRHVSMYLLHEVAKQSKSQIGKTFSTNHTTVIAAVKKIKDRIKKESSFHLVIENFRKKFEFQ